MLTFVRRHHAHGRVLCIQGWIQNIVIILYTTLVSWFIFVLYQEIVSTELRCGETQRTLSRATQKPLRLFRFFGSSLARARISHAKQDGGLASRLINCNKRPMIYRMLVFVYGLSSLSPFISFTFLTHFSCESRTVVPSAHTCVFFSQ